MDITSTSFLTDILPVPSLSNTWATGNWDRLTFLHCIHLQQQHFDLPEYMFSSQDLHKSFGVACVAFLRSSIKQPAAHGSLAAISPLDLQPAMWPRASCHELGQNEMPCGNLAISPNYEDPKEMHRKSWWKYWCFQVNSLSDREEALSELSLCVSSLHRMHGMSSINALNLL